MNDVLKEVSGIIDELKTFEDVLEMAISMEEQGKEFYLEKASTIKSVETIGLYNYLAGEESRHADYLRQYRKDKTVPDVRSKAPDFKTSFSEEFIDDRLGEIGVLLAALRFERKSEYFYTELSKRAENKTQHDFFDKLASFERGHYELIDGFLGESTQFRMQT